MTNEQQQRAIQRLRELEHVEELEARFPVRHYRITEPKSDANWKGYLFIGAVSLVVLWALARAL
jgi:hypothetical protein